jgi:SpoVK/Ycf46/Vps4 family AAA+-type ATPase
MMWETKKRSNDASRKDIDAEERWLENCGEDEEFLKRENKRLHRDLLRISPVYIGGSDSAAGENSFQGWESVAGLKDVIRCMKEVVIIPLLYPNFFDNLGLTPPRGVLLHGYPGTGKTLVVRSLIGACARGDRRIAYFARKGADCLGKYVGDAERQLRLLFQVAEKCQPSIIFFDEIDGLAPCRTRQQDQTHSSVVSTLLALMDGLKSRGSVVVIGATNRPEAVDPALRRPGRFDREIYFPLPSTEDRASILSLHTQKWPKPISGSLLGWIAKKTSGFAGADLQALCTQAAMNALKRNFPLQEVLSVAEKRHSSGCKNTPLPSFSVEERDWVEAFLSSPLPCSQREAGNAANDVVCSPLPVQLVPCLLRPLCTILLSLYLDERLWLPLPISKAVTLIKNVMICALDKKKMPIDHWWLHLDDFLQETNIAYEVSKCLSCSGILSADRGFSDSCDIVDHDDDDKPSLKNHASMRNGRLPDMSFSSTNKSGFRILIYGNPRSGQRHLASCLLYCFVGNIEVQKIDMATITQEGHGDVVQGISQILSMPLFPRFHLCNVDY